MRRLLSTSRGTEVDGESFRSREPLARGPSSSASSELEKARRLVGWNLLQLASKSGRRRSMFRPDGTARSPGIVSCAGEPHHQFGHIDLRADEPFSSCKLELELIA